MSALQIVGRGPRTRLGDGRADAGRRWHRLSHQQTAERLRNGEGAEFLAATSAGVRSLALDPDTTVELEAYVRLWAEERRLLGQTSQLLFVWPSGQPLHPDTITSLFHKHCEAAGLPRIRLQDVRHSYASAALKAGISPKVISERLGHSTVAFTLQTYAHVLPGMDQSAADTVAALIIGTDTGANTDGRILGRQLESKPEKQNWPGTKSQASGGSGGRI